MSFSLVSFLMFLCHIKWWLCKKRCRHILKYKSKHGCRRRNSLALVGYISFIALLFTDSWFWNLDLWDRKRHLINSFLFDFRVHARIVAVLVSKHRDFSIKLDRHTKKFLIESLRSFSLERTSFQIQY